MDHAFKTADIRTQSTAALGDETTPKRDIRWVFLGREGLRAGWSVVLFVTIFLVTDQLMAWMLNPLLHRMRGGHTAPFPLPFAFVLEFVQASGMFVAVFIMARIEGRPILAYGYQDRAWSVRLLFGLLLGFVAISAFVLTLAKAGMLSLDGFLLHGTEIWKYGAGWLCLFFFVAVFEESLMRGYVQYTLTRGLGFWWGALLLSLIFGFGHGTNPGETPVGLFSAAAVGLVLCLSLWYTGSLWWALGFHAAWDWGESYFYGTADSGMVAQGRLLGEHPVGKALWSGGATGPEGSLLVLPLLGLFALIMWLWWGRGWGWHTQPHRQAAFPGSGWRPASTDHQTLSTPIV